MLLSLYFKNFGPHTLNSLSFISLIILYNITKQTYMSQSPFVIVLSDLFEIVSLLLKINKNKYIMMQA